MCEAGSESFPSTVGTGDGTHVTQACVSSAFYPLRHPTGPMQLSSLTSYMVLNRYLGIYLSLMALYRLYRCCSEKWLLFFLMPSSLATSSLLWAKFHLILSALEREEAFLNCPVSYSGVQPLGVCLWKWWSSMASFLKHMFLSSWHILLIKNSERQPL